jgi:phospholipase/carboxylesterase
VDTIYDIIKNKQLDLGLTNKDTILVGFSQGTMTSLYLNFLQNEPFLALIAFSGALIKPDKLINKTTPICLIHGREDDVVPVTEVDRISKYLLEHNIPSKSLVIPNLTHSIDKSGLDFMMNFITTLDQVQA